MWPSAIALAVKLWDGLVWAVKATGRLLGRVSGRRAFDAQQKSDEDLHAKVEGGEVNGLNERLGFKKKDK